MSLTVVAALLAFATVTALAWGRNTGKKLAEGHRQLEAKNDELTLRGQQSDLMEGRYRDLFESVPIAIIVSRMDGSLLDINRAGMAIFGYGERDEIMAINMRSVYNNPAERDRRIAASLEEPEPRAREFRFKRRDGTTFPALAVNRIVRDKEGKPSHIEGFITDISEYKQLEEDRRVMEQEQRMSQRLKSVGSLAAGIAHEINTPMQFVSDSVYFLKTAIGELNVLWPELAALSQGNRKAEDSEEAIKRIGAAMSLIDVDQLVLDANGSAERALDGIRRVTKIIRAMREFAHPDNGERTHVDINVAIETTLIVCKNVYKEVAQVETDFGALPAVLCQYGEINQVFLNIIVNASHAIEAQRNESLLGMIRIATYAEEGWVVIRIQDNGSGMPESVKARIFDPFFTTKEVGKGTGQGLAIVQSVIVERHRGRITVESEVGKGTTFILRLPLEQGKTETSGAANEDQA